MREKWLHLKKFLTARICGWTVPITLGGALIFIAFWFLYPVGFGGWFVERIRELIHQWF
jgi:hypothetical protein